MRFSLLVSAAAACLLCGGTAHASWYQAQSRHFVIYADDNPSNLRNFAGWLERFDSGVRYIKQMADPEVGNGNRLTVYVLPKAQDVRLLAGDKTGFLDGFYTGRISGSLAYIARDATVGEDGKSVFYHEYTHHLMMQDQQRPFPEWYVEGFAEFFSSPKFDRDGGIWFGRPPLFRADDILYGIRVPLDVLLNGIHEKMTAQQRSAFYGRGWLLTHYLLLGAKGREGQLSAYVQALSAGSSPLDAAQKAFGDLGKLDRELDAYRNKPLVSFKIAPDKLRTGAIQVTPLSPGAARAILLQSKIKYKQNQPAEALAAQARAVEAQAVGDEMVERTLAEAELNADHAQAAEAAADRALKANPTSTEAMVLKGRAMAKVAEATDDRDAAHALFEKARAALIGANKIDSEDPEPLYEFYRTYIEEGVRPTGNAIDALHYASELAPQDLGVRMNSAIAYLNEGKFAEARSTLVVVAYSPHSKSTGEMARRLIAEIDAGRGKNALMLLRSAPAGGSD
jgi:tetratricopeptide (TPR) repeat protein